MKSINSSKNWISSIYSKCNFYVVNLTWFRKLCLKFKVIIILWSILFYEISIIHYYLICDFLSFKIVGELCWYQPFRQVSRLTWFYKKKPLLWKSDFFHTFHISKKISFSDSGNPLIYQVNIEAWQSGIYSQTNQFYGHCFRSNWPKLLNAKCWKNWNSTFSII